MTVQLTEKEALVSKYLQESTSMSERLKQQTTGNDSLKQSMENIEKEKSL